MMEDPTTVEALAKASPCKIIVPLEVCSYPINILWLCVTGYQTMGMMAT